jgi:hypothetical protein
MGDMQGAIDYLRALPYVNGKVGVIGFCSGGRQTYLGACTLRGIDAVAVCYGGGVAAKPEELTPRQPVAPIDFTKDLRCPLLDSSASKTRALETDAAKPKKRSENSARPTSFTPTKTLTMHFAVDRAQYRVHAAVDGWKRVFAWFGKHSLAASMLRCDRGPVISTKSEISGPCIKPMLICTACGACAGFPRARCGSSAQRRGGAPIRSRESSRHRSPSADNRLWSIPAPARHHRRNRCAAKSAPDGHTR